MEGDEPVPSQLQREQFAAYSFAVECGMVGSSLAVGVWFYRMHLQMNEYKPTL